VISSDTHRRKTREIPLLLWAAEDPALASLRVKASELVKSHPYELLTPLWGLPITMFPMLGHLVCLISKTGEHQYALASVQIKQKALDAWGRELHCGEGLREDAGLA